MKCKLHRTVPLQGHEGATGAEPHQDAGEDGTGGG